MELKEELEKKLITINKFPGVLASLIIRKDGLCLAFLSNEDKINKDIAVSVASVFNIFEQTAEELKTEPLNYLLIKSQNNNLFFIEVSKDIILVLILDISAEINKIYEESIKITQKIIEILS
ncbi:roadblock/LC7 domain-containing protein [Candidatus Micrarchaeota archaeon]|nr:roadblock/LC7 domain-containing protein [Candidatus Micrarchaeota archaeon]